MRVVRAKRQPVPAQRVLVRSERQMLMVDSILSKIVEHRYTREPIVRVSVRQDRRFGFQASIDFLE